MPFTTGHNPNRVSAFDLVTGSFESIEQTFYEVKYGEIMWNQVIREDAIDTSINPGATTTSYRVTDWRGQASFRAHHDDDIPTVGRTIDKNLVPIEVAGVSGIFDREDARQVQFGYGENMLQTLPQIMRLACERHVEGTFFYGNDDLGFNGWLDYPGVTIQNVPNGGGGSPLWVNKTADEIQFDVNNALSTVWCESKEVHMPDTVYLPCDLFAFISSQRMSTAADKSVLDYLKTNNVYTAKTGNELKFMSVRYLTGAGVGSVNRMVVAETSKKENVVLPFPLPFDLLEPQLDGFDVKLFAEYKVGSFHARYPKSMLYADGI